MARWGASVSLSYPVASDHQLARLLQIGLVLEEVDEARATQQHERLDDELDFDGIASYLTAAIQTGTDAGADIAVDVTPGRRFWAILSFQAGTRFDVDHIYYGHVLSSEYYSTPFPNIPRTAFSLLDFTEVIG